MRIKLEIGNGHVMVDCVVSLEDEMVTEVIYRHSNSKVNIVDCLELATLDKITEAAQKKFAEEMSEP